MFTAMADDWEDDDYVSIKRFDPFVNFRPIVNSPTTF